MKQLIYKSLICLLMVISSNIMYAQDGGGGEPMEGEDPRPGPCICYPMPLPTPIYDCSNVPLSAACKANNLDFEDLHFFKNWVGNYGIACKKKVQVTNKYDIGFYNMKLHTPRYTLIDSTYPAYDPYCGFPTRPPLGGNHSVMLGDSFPLAHAETIMSTIKIEKSDPFISLYYAFVLSNICNDSTQEPYFSIKIYNTATCKKVLDFNYKLSMAASIPGLKYTPNGAFGYKDWTTLQLDMLKLFADTSHSDEYFTIEATASDCGYCVHTGYAYFDAKCGKNTIVPGGGTLIPKDTTIIIIPHDTTTTPPVTPPVIPTQPGTFNGLIRCVGENVTFTGHGNVFFMDENYLWDFGDGKGWSTEREPTYFYTAAGLYTVKIKIKTPTGGPVFDTEDTIQIQIVNCCTLENVPKIKAEDCITTFSPVEGETYILHAWVKEDITNPDADSRIVSYTKGSPHITLTFSNESDFSPVVINCFPSGPVIDGWQRIEKEFTVPSCPGAKIDLDIALNSLTWGDEGTYFDDVRIFPKKGGMKSFVYDAASQKLLAELDEENFATFYEYDQEGALIRVKKETERGIKTIKEAGNNTKKP